MINISNKLFNEYITKCCYRDDSSVATPTYDHIPSREVQDKRERPTCKNMS